jgi:sulfoquinovosyltransferase
VRSRISSSPHSLPYYSIVLYGVGKNYLGFIPRVENTCWDLLRYAHSRADLTLVTSPQMQEELRAHGIPRVEVWRKGIDTERFHPSFYNQAMRERMSDGHPNDFLMVYIGRLGAEKRLKDIKAMLQRMPKARLCIVGAGPQKEELEEYFKGEKCLFTGQLSGDDLSSAFASADAFVMPSDSETLGFVVLESMASGVPVVGAAAGGILDLIDDGKTSFFAQPGDTDGFVRRLTQLQDAKFRKKMGKAARAEAERWGWEAATLHLRDVQYEKAVHNFHSRAFGGFGRPGTAGLWRLLEWRIRSVIRRVRGQKAVFASVLKRWLRWPRLFSWTKSTTVS